MSLSKIVISGTIKQKPEKRFTTSNIPVCNFYLIVSYFGKGSQGSEYSLQGQTVRITAWRDLAEQCEQEFNAGDKVLINGRLQINNYTTQDGKKKRDAEIDASSIILLDKLIQMQTPVIEGFNKSDLKSTKKTDSDSSEEILDFNDLNSTEEIPF